MMPKIVNRPTAFKTKAKAWTFEAKAIGRSEAKAKAKTIRIVPEAPRGQGLASSWIEV